MALISFAGAGISHYNKNNQMADQDTTTEPVLSNTDLAFERTILAESRTLMAWIRTSISLVSFGFTIYKFFHETAADVHRLLTPRKVGMLMIGIGILALVWGMMEHRDTIKKLKKSYPGLKPSRTAWLAILILLFGIILFLGALFKQ
jgi:putative membrane protein